MTEITHDVFISHAYEDKISFTNELALALKAEGLKVWYSGFELKVGESIMTRVNNGLKCSKYAVVVISPVYLEKTWAMNELQALFAQETDQKRILPILHHISVDEIKIRFPLMADRYAISSASSMEFIVAKILEVVKSGQKTYSDIPKKKTITLGMLANPMTPVLLLLEAPQLLAKIFPNLKSKNRKNPPKH